MGVEEEMKRSRNEEEKGYGEREKSGMRCGDDRVMRPSFV
jgi:hypothetical protein